MARPHLEMSETQRVLHHLREAELKFARISERFDANHGADYDRHVQVICAARTMAQGGDFNRARAEIRRARDIAEAATASSLVIEATVETLAGRRQKALESLDRARRLYQLGDSTDREMATACATAVFAVTEDRSLEETARQALQSTGLMIKSHFFCDFEAAAKRLGLSPPRIPTVTLT